MKFSLTTICTVAILAAAASRTEALVMKKPSARSHVGSNDNAKMHHQSRLYAPKKIGRKATAKSNAKMKKTQAKKQAAKDATAKTIDHANVSLGGTNVGCCWGFLCPIYDCECCHD